MKLATFAHQGVERVGLVDVAKATVSAVGLRGVDRVPTMLDLVRTTATEADLKPVGSAIGLDQVQLRAPIPRPVRNVFCVGKNYYDSQRHLSGPGHHPARSSGQLFPLDH